MRPLILLLLAAVAATGCRPAPNPASVETPFVVEVLAEGLNNPWSLAFLPDGGALITEKFGGVRLMGKRGLDPRPMSGGPVNVLQDGDSGLLDVALDPDFAANRFVYIAFNEGDARANRLALYKARFDGRLLSQGRVIFRAHPDKAQSHHSGGRILFLPDKTLLLTSSDGFDYRDQAQNLNSDLGKTLRLDREGRPPADNPFAGRPGAPAEIWSYGHRNAMGLVRDPRDGAIWEHENGPRGGDEINRLKPGLNYGWPKTTYGVDYSGELISKLQKAPGIEEPVVIWTPSIAPSGMALYLGDKFPQWRGDLFVGGLAEQSLRRVRIRNGAWSQQEIFLRERGQRIRDVRAGPDGLIYLLTDGGELLRLRPPS